MAGFNHLSEMGEQIERAISELVRKAAFDVQAQAQQNAPVATGFLKSSIYTVTYDSSSYGQGVVGDGMLLPEVEHPSSQQEALVAVGAEYGVFQEYGWSTGPAQPYLTPAAEAVTPTFQAAMSRLEEHLKGFGE